MHAHLIVEGFPFYEVKSPLSIIRTISLGNDSISLLAVVAVALVNTAP